MADAARLIQGGNRPVARARFSAPEPERGEWRWHQTKWAGLPSRLLWGGDRRMEAENYLSSGHGIRLAIESRPQGWTRFDHHARIWQPSRLKGIQVDPSYGTPFLAATQVFDLRPVPRKWISLARTPDNAQRFVKEGTIMLTCSGAVGKATLALKPHSELLISHDLLRIEAKQENDTGWLYAYLRSSMVRQIMTGSHYGHVIKHLEISHISALPMPRLNPIWIHRFNLYYRKIIKMRNEAHAHLLAAEDIFENSFDGAAGINGGGTARECS